MTDVPRPFRPGPSPRRVWAARLLALVADAIQIAFLPVFGAGFLSPATDFIDVAMAVTLTALVGWHWAFLPTFLAEIVPGVGLIPTWTLAAFIATRKHT